MAVCFYVLGKAIKLFLFPVGKMALLLSETTNTLLRVERNWKLGDLSISVWGKKWPSLFFPFFSFIDPPVSLNHHFNTLKFPPT